MSIQENIDILKRFLVSIDIEYNNLPYIKACEFLYKKHNIDFTSVFDLISSCRANWIFCSIKLSEKYTNYLKIILKEWVVNPPRKIILDKIKYNIEELNKLEEKYRMIFLYKCDSELLSLMMFFGFKIDSYIEENKIRQLLLEESKIRSEHLVAGKKIVNFVEKWMDDKFEMRPMRDKIALRKFEDLVEEQKSN